MKKFLRSLYIAALLYLAVGTVIVLLIFGFFFPAIFGIARYFLWTLLALLAVDLLMLYRNDRGIFARRDTLEKFSNGDQNPINIIVENHYLFPVKLILIDELPHQFQVRDSFFSLKLDTGKSTVVQYELRPVKRGEYHFGAVHVFASSPIGFIRRKFSFSNDQKVPVYPSFMQMRKYELLAISNRLNEAGIKKIRKIGNNSEFDQIREYVAGDDFRTINWKATARKNKLMINQYQDERSQQVYSIIDMGRVMRMPFEGLSLLDYAINSSLVISNIAMLKSDKAGIITFSNTVQSVLPAERKSGHLNKILQLLYNQKTGYLESDFENLYLNIRGRITQRSLLILYTNFESLSGLKRQLKYLRRIAKDHLLVVVFFENTELEALLNKPAENTQDVYNKAIAEKFSLEKKQIVKELEKYGIHSILTAPQHLSVNTINKYLELKSRGLI